MSRAARCWIVLSAALGPALCAGCGTLPNGRGWGQDATLAPGWERVRAAATKNVLDPWTWIPIAGAAALQIDHFDRRISDWARDETPIFGSEQNATDASDQLRDLSRDVWLASLLATKSGDDVGTWTLSKAKGFLVEDVARALPRGLTSVLKDVSGRTRPNGTDDRSFPSGHMTEAYGNALMASRNLDATGLPAGIVWPLRVGEYGLAFGTGWARVEAGAHFPSDVLFATGATNFLAGFVHDAFLGIGSQPTFSVTPAPEGGGIEAGLSWSF